MIVRRDYEQDLLTPRLKQDSMRRSTDQEWIEIFVLSQVCSNQSEAGNEITGHRQSTNYKKSTQPV